MAVASERLQTWDVAEPPISGRLPLVPEQRHDTDGSERVELERLIELAEAAVVEQRYDEVAGSLAGTSRRAMAHADLALRALFAESWALMYLGRLDDALEILCRGRTIAERPDASELDRAEIFFRLGCCRFLRGQPADGAALFTLALDLCERSGRPDDRLRAHVLEWRSRCYQHFRDFTAARADAERALELAEGAGDDETRAHALFQSSVVAEREGQWLLARCYAEQALVLYEELGDRVNAHKVLNNLGGINFLAGSHAKAVECLQASFRIALELDDDVYAGYAISSLSRVQLESGEPGDAERHARRALELLGDRTDHLAEVGNAGLVLARALLEQGGLDEADSALAAAARTFEDVGSKSHRAAVWVVEGDLAARRGDTALAADRYRAAAQSLQDFHF